MRNTRHRCAMQAVKLSIDQLYRTQSPGIIEIMPPMCHAGGKTEYRSIISNSKPWQYRNHMQNSSTTAIPSPSPPPPPSPSPTITTKKTYLSRSSDDVWDGFNVLCQVIRLLLSRLLGVPWHGLDALHGFIHLPRAFFNVYQHFFFHAWDRSDSY